MTPLHGASMNGYFEVVKLLLNNGADPTVANNDGITPAYSALINGYFNVFKLLLDEGADVNFQEGLYGSILVSIVPVQIQSAAYPANHTSSISTSLPIMDIQIYCD